MPKRRTILLTNDDGYFSDGLKALYQTLKRYHQVYIVAPDREQSASSHSLTLNRPLRIHKLDDHIYATDGTPTDCVMLAIHRLFKKRLPDMIVSGINHGANMGDDITYSGTVAAAIEGSICGIPSIAVSMANWEPGMRMSGVASFTARFISRFGSLHVPPSTIININFPPDPGVGRADAIYNDFEFTSQGIRYYRDIIVAKKDPRGKPYYWIGGRAKWKTTKGTDFATVKRGLVSVTPLQLDFTDQAALSRLREEKTGK